VIAPPLIIAKSDIDHGVAALDEALSIADAEAED
jgi:4-aminobutyrate aminotransferase-like enzyme